MRIGGSTLLACRSAVLVGGSTVLVTRSSGADTAVGGMFGCP